MNLLLLHVKKNKLPAAVLDALLTDHRLTVITEPHHEQVYPPQVQVRLVDDVRNVELVRKAAFDLMPAGRFDRVLTAFELGLTVGAYLRRYFGLPGIDFEVANNFANKFVMKQRYQAEGIHTPAHALACGLADVPRVADAMGWPVIVKPVYGGGSMDIATFSSADDFQRFFESEAANSLRALDMPLIVERLLRLVGEYHCDGVVDDGRVVFAAPAKYLSPLLNCPEGRNGSYFLPAEHPHRALIEELHAKAVVALGLRSGVTHMEFLETDDGLLAGEIACRPAGGGIPAAVLLGHGVDLWRAWLDCSLGRTPNLEPRPRPGLLVNFHLPVRPGRITALSSAADLSRLPGVVKVDMVKQVGDVVPEKYNSSYTTGLVYLDAGAEDRVDPMLAALCANFRLETQP